MVVLPRSVLRVLLWGVTLMSPPAEPSSDAAGMLSVMSHPLAAAVVRQVGLDTHPAERSRCTEAATLFNERALV